MFLWLVVETTAAKVSMHDVCVRQGMETREMPKNNNSHISVILEKLELEQQTYRIINQECVHCAKHQIGKLRRKS
jgi:hypothetical protein